MINCFYDVEKREWVISTKSIVGANTMFSTDYENNITFLVLFGGWL